MKIMKILRKVQCIIEIDPAKIGVSEEIVYQKKYLV